MADKKTYDVSKCMFNPDSFGNDKKIQDVYPETASYDEFKIESQDDIKIAILLSDFDSPFLKVKNTNLRLTEIFKYLGIDKYKGKGKKKFTDIEGFTYIPIFNICAVYIEMQNNEEFAYWWSMSRTYYDLMKVLSAPFNPEKDDIDRYVKRKLSIQNQANEIKNTIKETEIKLFGSAKMKMQVARAKLKKERTYAEMFAQQNRVE